MTLTDVIKTGGTYPVVDYEAGPGEGGNLWKSQQFIPSANNICGLILPLKREGAPTGNVIIEIQSDVGNYPSGSVLASYTFSTSTVTEDGSDYYITFTAVQLIPGQKYHICLKADAYWDANNCIYWAETYGTYTDYICTGMSVFSLQTNMLQFDIQTLYKAGFTVYQYADVKKTGGDTAYSLEDNYWYAQQFQPTRPNISGVDLHIAAVGSPTGTITIEVQSDLANSPTGTVLTSATLDSATLSTTLGWVKVVLPRYNFPLMSKKYWVCVKGQDSWTGTDYVYWEGKAGTYSDKCRYGPGDFTNLFAGQMDIHTLYNVVPVDYSVYEPTDTFPQLTIYDDIMDAQAIIREAEAFQFTEDWYYPDTWSLKIAGIKPGADTIELLGHVGWVDAQGVNHIGIIEKIEQPRTRDSVTWTISGRGSLALFARRRCLEEWTNSGAGGYDVQSDVFYETAMRHYVDQEIISCTDTDRRIAGISLNVEDTLRGLDYNGDKCEKKVRGEPLLDILQDLSQTSTLSCDLIWTGGSQTPGNRYKWRFDVLDGTDRRNSVKLSIKFSNVLNYKYAESVLNLATVEYVAGEGSGATRALTAVYHAPTTGRDRFEDFIDAADCTSADLRTERGLEMLAQKVADKTFEFEYNPNSQNSVYGVDFFLGDIITVSDPEIGVTMIDRVTTVTTNYTAKGKTITIGMGTRPLDLLSLERVKRKRDGTGAKT